MLRALAISVAPQPLRLQLADGAHSLRADFLTNAERRGASVFKMRDV
jgi:hypothetical protein